MKKLHKIFIFFLMTVIVGNFIFAQDGTPKNADVVILVDTSGGILQYYEEINSRVIKKITNSFIRKGDTVHVLSFNSSARYEISQKINTEKDFSRVISRFLLLYQLGQNSDFLTGLDFCKKYTSRLPKKEEQILIVISDGIFNPPATSPYKNYSDQQVKNEIANLSGSIRKTGWKVYYVKLPYPDDALIRNLDGEEFYTGADKTASGNNTTAGTKGGYADGTTGDNSASDNNSGSDGTSAGNGTAGSTNSSGDKSTRGNSTTESYSDISGSFTESSGAATTEVTKDKDKDFEINKNIKKFPIVAFPDSLEAYGNKLKFSLKISNKTDEATTLQLEKIILDDGTDLKEIEVNTKAVTINSGEEAIVNVSAKLSDTYEEGNHTVLLALQFANDKKVLPQASELRLSVFPSTVKRIFGSNLLFIIIILLTLLLLLLLIFFLIRRKSASPVSNTTRRAGLSKDNEERRKLNKLEEEDDHAKRLKEFGNKNTTVKGSGSGLGDSSYSYDSLDNSIDKIAAQKTADEALSAKILKGSLASQQPRGSYMSPANHMEKIEIKEHKSGMSEIFVLNQNRNIGKRNIHVMKAGTRLSVGGGKSDDFLIFLVPFPSKLAQVRFDGKDYHLAILKPEFFPYETSNVVNNCIGKTITAVSEKGYHIYFTFRDYEDPATKLNTLLNSINYK